MPARAQVAGSLVAAAVLAALGGAPVIAQDATPAALQSESSAAAQADPQVGDAVSFVDETGAELGTVSVVEVIDPFTDFGEFFTPEEGARYVAVQITVAGTDGSVEANANDFGLQTADGFYFAPAFVNRDITTADIPDLERIEVAPGTETTGLVFYAVPQGAEIARLLWQPENGRLLVIADLR